MIDLHTHSTASDGTLTPKQLVELAVERNLEAIALTDHDTVAGIDEFLAAGEPCALETIPGVEIACSWYGASLHLLGLFIDHKNTPLLELLQEIRENREKRNQRILNLLQEQGIPIPWERILAESNGQVVGRPHIARALVAEGYCADMQDAFARFIGRDAPCYSPRFLPMPKRTIETLHGAGALAILAHPFGGAKPMKTILIRRKIKRLKTMGLDGMEVYYSDYTRRQTERALKIANDLTLIKTGGSDFHGDNMPGVEIGVGRGNLKVPAELLNEATLPATFTPLQPTISKPRNN